MSRSSRCAGRPARLATPTATAAFRVEPPRLLHAEENQPLPVEIAHGGGEPPVGVPVRAGPPAGVAPSPVRTELEPGQPQRGYPGVGDDADELGLERGHPADLPRPEGTPPAGRVRCSATGGRPLRTAPRTPDPGATVVGHPGCSPGSSVRDQGAPAGTGALPFELGGRDGTPPAPRRRTPGHARAGTRRPRMLASSGGPRPRWRRGASGTPSPSPTPSSTFPSPKPYGPNRVAITGGGARAPRSGSAGGTGRSTARRRRRRRSSGSRSGARATRRGAARCPHRTLST